MTGLQSLSHCVHIAHAFEGVIQASISQLHQDLLQWLLIVFRVHKFGEAELFSCVKVDGRTSGF